MWNPPIVQPSHARQRAEWTATPPPNDATSPPLPQHTRPSHQRDASVASLPPLPQAPLPPVSSPIPAPDAPEQKRLRKKNRDQDRDRDSTTTTTTTNDRDRERNSRTPSIPTIDLQIRQIYAECEAAHGKARLLSENVALANPDDVEAETDSEGGIIQEFYVECMRAQERVLSQISWATAEAEKSREREMLRQAMVDAALASPTVPGMNGGGAILSPSSKQQKQKREQRQTVVTKEEEMLAALLSANQALTDALQLRDDWQRAAIAQREERFVEERSRVETRIDRSVSSSFFAQLDPFTSYFDSISGTDARS